MILRMNPHLEQYYYDYVLAFITKIIIENKHFNHVYE